VPVRERLRRWGWGAHVGAVPLIADRSRGMVNHMVVNGVVAGSKIAQLQLIQINAVMCSEIDPEQVLQHHRA